MIVALLIALASLAFSMLTFALVLGLFSRARHEIELVQEYPISAEALLRVIADVEAYPTWRRGIVKVESLSTTRWREVGKRVAREFEVIDEVRPAEGPDGLGRRAHRIADPRSRVQGQWIFGFEPRGKHCALFLIEQAEVANPVLRGLARIWFPPHKAMQAFLTDLQKRVHQQVAN